MYSVIWQGSIVMVIRIVSVMAGYSSRVTVMSRLYYPVLSNESVCRLKVFEGSSYWRKAE